MKIFAIRDDNNENKDLAYLIYYETEKKFYIELPYSVDEWEAPLILSSFIKRGQYTVNSYWSGIWVKQRIVPTDRQNIAQILKVNKIREYDEYELLKLTSGRCEQDDYYLVQITSLPDEVLERFKYRIEDVIPISDTNLIIFFSDGNVKKCNLLDIFKNNPQFDAIAQNSAYFNKVDIEPGGYGIRWDDNLRISDKELYENGEVIPLTADDFIAFASNRVITAAEAATILDCSRQYINELVKTDKLHPIKVSEKTTLLLKSEVLKRNWQ